MRAMTLPWPKPQRAKYRAGTYCDWSCQRTPPITTTSTGYFCLHASQPPGWMFKKREVIWMSLAAMEQESHLPHIAAARGHVVIAGLGMGFVTYNVARKPEVTKVTVLERDQRVITLMDRVTNWRSWPKVDLVHGDALTYQPDEPVDFLYADIWEKLGAEKGMTLTKAIQANVGAARVGLWGQEIEFLDWCRKQRLPVTDVTQRHYLRFARTSGLPLIGGEWVGYARLAAAAGILQCLSRCTLEEARLLLSIYHGLVAEYLIEVAPARQSSNQAPGAV